MPQLIYTRVLIDGADLLSGSNYRILLHQPMADHHVLKITCPTESLEDLTSNFANKAKQFIGSKIVLSIGSGTGFGQISTEDIKFQGLVTNVNINKHDGSDGLMTITAYSPTILLSHGKDSQSFERKTLPEIIQAATKEYPSDLVKFNLDPKYKNPIPYTVQYKEDDFSFIKRLATRYGEWFYYDGQTIQFGPAGFGNAKVDYGVDLTSFDFGLQTRPQDHTYFAYDSLQAKVHDSSMQAQTESVNNPFINHVTAVSKKLFTKRPQSVYNHSLMENGLAELDQVARLKAGQAQNTVHFSGEGDSTKIKLGEAVNIFGRNTITKQTEFYGKYLITEVIHSVDTAGEYDNQFRGVPVDIKVPPYFDEDAVPMCEEQYAIVKDNNDPQGLSRIRVQFPWQRITNELSPWIRVTTPYAGKGKGMHILPELDEEVLVNFEGGCAEKPVVIGTMFHGSAKSGHGGAGNYTKALQTASGSGVEFNDNSGHSRIWDKAGDEVNLDGGGNITITAQNKNTITAPDKNTIKTKVSEITAEQTHTVNVGESQSLFIMNQEGKITIKSLTSITLDVLGNTLKIDENGITITAVSGEISATAQAGGVTIDAGGGDMKVTSSGNSDVSASGNMSISSSLTKISGSSKVSVNGGKVELNNG